MKNLLRIIVVVLIICGCDNFNSPLKGYIEEATSTAKGLDWSISTPHHKRTDGIVAITPHGEHPGDPHTEIKISLRNLQRYALELGLAYRGDVNLGGIASLASISGIYPELSPDRQEVYISLPYPAHGDTYPCKLTISANGRVMEDFKLPVMEVRYMNNNLDSLSVMWSGSERLAGFDPSITNYTVDLPPGAAGGSIDITAGLPPGVHSSCAINGIAGSSLTINGLQTGTNNVTVLVTADSGKTNAYTLAVNVGPASGMAARVEGTGVEYTSLAAALDSVGNNQTETITVLMDLPNQRPYTISGTSKTINLVSNSNYTIQLGATNGSLLTVNSGVALRIGDSSSVIGGALSHGVLTLKGRTDNDSSLVSVNDGTLELYDNAVITGNTNTYSDGGAVRVIGNGSSFTMRGGSIKGNRSDCMSYGGGGVFVNGGIFTMSGSTAVIKGNSAFWGGGVAILNGQFTFSAGTIGGDGGAPDRNNATYGGGGVNLVGGTFGMTGSAKIMGNYTPSYGGGVYIGSGTFYMSGGIIYGTDTPADVMKNNASNGASLFINGGAASYAAPFPAGPITSPNDATLPDFEALVSTNGSDTFTTIDYAFSTLLQSSGSDAIVTILRNAIKQSPNVYLIQRKITLKSDNACQISFGSLVSGSMFNVASGGTLIIGGASNIITLQGKPYNSAALITVNGGALELNTNANITGNSNSGGNGGGVAVNSGIFVMKGGQIYSNSAANGGGVYVSGSGTNFNMEGGTIGGTGAADKNRAAERGGGVYVAGGTFNLSGGTIGGEGTDCNYAGDGGGVYAAGGTFAISGSAFIRGNTAYTDVIGPTYGYGGGVYVSGPGTNFSMNGGTIGGTGESNQNSAQNHGGGVFITGVSFYMYNGIIGGPAQGCNDAGFGGGVSIGTGASMTMGLGTIGGNTARIQGGGMFMSYDSTSFIMSGGLIYGSGAGGNSNIVISGPGTGMGDSLYINGNPMAQYGGGVYIIPGSGPRGIDTTLTP